MRSWLLVSLVSFIACGGSSERKGSEAPSADAGSGGSTESGGATGTAGTLEGKAGYPGTGGTAEGKAGAPGTGGTGVGADGGSGARGGSGGGAGQGEAGEPGVGATGATGSGATGGSGGTDATGGDAGVGAMTGITSCTDDFAFEGVWQGKVLDFYFEPLEELELIVKPDEELGGYQATLTFGSGDPPPPATSADEPYPDLEFWQGADWEEPRIEPWPGFAHMVVRGAGCDDVFRVSISVSEPWDEWCSLQEPVFTEEYGWGCTYRGGGSANMDSCQVQDNRGQPLADYPLWKCQACGAFGGGGVCSCDAEGCGFNHTPTHTYDLELSDDGSVLSGPDPTCGDCTVRLERVE